MTASRLHTWRTGIHAARHQVQGTGEKQGKEISQYPSHTATVFLSTWHRHIHMCRPALTQHVNAAQQGFASPLQQGYD